MEAIALSIGAINALVPVIVILILIAAAAGLTRGSEIFRLFGVSTLLGIRTGRGTLSGKSPFKAKARVSGGGGAGVLGGLLVKGAKDVNQKFANKKLAAAAYEKGGQAIINDLKAGGTGDFAYSSAIISIKGSSPGPSSSSTSGMVQMSTSKTLQSSIRLQNPSKHADLTQHIRNTVGKVDKESTARFKGILDQKLEPKAEKAALAQALKQHVQGMEAAHKDLIKQAKSMEKAARSNATPDFLLNSKESLRDQTIILRRYGLELASQQTDATIKKLEANQIAKDALEKKARSLGGTSKLSLDDQDKLKSFGKLDTNSYVKKLEKIESKIKGIEKNNKELFDQYHPQIEEAAKKQLELKKTLGELEKITNAQKFNELHN